MPRYGTQFTQRLRKPDVTSNASRRPGSQTVIGPTNGPVENTQ